MSFHSHLQASFEYPAALRGRMQDGGTGSTEPDEPKHSRAVPVPQAPVGHQSWPSFFFEKENKFIMRLELFSRL